MRLSADLAKFALHSAIKNGIEIPSIHFTSIHFTSNKPQGEIQELAKQTIRKLKLEVYQSLYEPIPLLFFSSFAEKKKKKLGSLWGPLMNQIRRRFYRKCVSFSAYSLEV